MTGFTHDIAGGGGNLIVTSLQSPNYAPGSAGWQVRKDGSAEFNNLTIRGTFNGTDFIINATGTFFYSGAPAAGNLIASIASAAGTDVFGNVYNAGVQSYIPGLGAAGLAAGELILYQWTGAAWASYGGFVANGSRLDINNTNGGGIGIPSGPFTSTAGTAASPTVITTDTWNAMALANAWANVAGFATARYRMTPNKQVEIIGAINAAAASAVTFFTLPAAYRPASQQPICAAGANASVPAGLSPWIRCDTGGNLTVQNTGAIPAAFQLFFHGFVSLDA